MRMRWSQKEDVVRSEEADFRIPFREYFTAQPFREFRSLRGATRSSALGSHSPGPTLSLRDKDWPANPRLSGWRNFYHALPARIQPMIHIVYRRGIKRVVGNLL